MFEAIIIQGLFKLIIVIEMFEAIIIQGLFKLIIAIIGVVIARLTLMMIIVLFHRGLKCSKLL